MKSRTGRYGRERRLCGFWLACWLLVWEATAWAQVVQAPNDADDSVAVIAHPSVDPAHLNREFLRSVFTLRIRVWPNGQPIRIFVFDDSDLVHASFCREVLGTFPYVLRRTWDRATFTGTGLVPVRVASIREMRRLVRDTPGAIGYLPRYQLGVSHSRMVTGQEIEL